MEDDWTAAAPDPSVAPQQPQQEPQQQAAAAAAAAADDAMDTDIVEKEEAGGILRASSRLTVIRRSEYALLYKHAPQNVSHALMSVECLM
jgi:hypothetical protein